MPSFTQYGFERENLQELVASELSIWRSALNTNIPEEDDNWVYRLITLNAEARNQNYQLIESLISNMNPYTAEGVWLDNLIGPYLERQGSTAGTGVVIIETNSSCPNNYVLAATTNIRATNGKSYNPNEATTLTDNVAAIKITKADMPNSTFQLTIKDTTDNIEYTMTTTGSNTNSSVALLAMNEIKSFILAHTTGNSSRVYVDNTNVVLYVGFDSSYELVGLEEYTNIRLSPLVGSKYNAVPVTCTTKGIYPVTQDSIISITPSFTGYVSVTNIDDFYSGDNPETDTEYLNRYLEQIGSVRYGTINAITRVLDGLTGVTQVRIYQNTTPSDTIEADANTINCVVIGGSSADIASAIYSTKPILQETSGTISVSVDTADGVTEDIRYTPGSERPLSLKINYISRNRQPLTETEKQTAIDSIVELSNLFRIGNSAIVRQVETAFLSVLDRNRLTDLKVYMKDQSASSSAYIASNFACDFDELLSIGNADISFNQVYATGEL